MEALGVAVGRAETKAMATVALFRGERGRGRGGGRKRDGWMEGGLRCSGSWRLQRMVSEQLAVAGVERERL